MTEEPLTAIRGVGPKRAEALAKMGLYTIEDLLRLIPNTYNDFSKERGIAELKHGDITAVKVRIINEAHLYRVNKRLSILSASALDDTGRIELVWFNQPFRAGSLSAGQVVYACGKVDNKKSLRMLNPMISEGLPGNLPVYPAADGISPSQIRNIIRTALEQHKESIRDMLPECVKNKYRLPGLFESLDQIHNICDPEQLPAALRRLEFEDVLLFLTALSFIRRFGQIKGISFDTEALQAEFAGLLGFELTRAQKRVIAEISEDMKNDKPMNRMVQGDVGSGKTAAAMFAIFAAVKNGYQGVFMAPTEILAEQHFQTLLRIFGKDTCLLKGGMKKAERESALSRIRSGEAKVIIGTQALIQAGVEFYNIGVVITDEQHRFGVRQRACLSSKGTTPDVLVMSATPIPRTLALIIFGDLDISVIDELPPGRKPVITKNVPQNKRSDMYAYIKKRIDEGRQGYVVCPLVDPSESVDALSASEVFDELKEIFGKSAIGLLHGQMKSTEKEETVERFREGNIALLVATTVIEVGVDVPNASIMVIENADRFGLSQLHQLRGRVGRGAIESYCFLLNGSDSETARDRLDFMARTHDGFMISQKDLELRGPGEFLGIRQHGMDIRVAKIFSDSKLLYEAKKTSEDILRSQKDQTDANNFITLAKNKYLNRLSEISPN
jgi:ATP-dependent DNA helicase RecG